MRNKAFTTVEMLVALILALVLMLAIGVISTVSLDSNRKQRVGLDTYNDIHYGFKLMENKVRSASINMTNQSAPGGSWRGARLDIGAAAFGIYRNGTKREFVYVPDISQINTRDVILSIDDPSDQNSTLNMTISPSTIIDSATVTILGTKEQFPFNLSMTVTKRSQ